jgi:hypothetical protein
MFISGVNDSKLFGGVNDTADKFITGVNLHLDLKMKNKQKINLQE